MSHGRGRFTPSLHLTMFDTRRMHEPPTPQKGHIFCERSPAIISGSLLFCSSAGSTTMGGSESVTLIDDGIIDNSIICCLNDFRNKRSISSLNCFFILFCRHIWIRSRKTMQKFELNLS